MATLRFQYKDYSEYQDSRQQQEKIIRCYMAILDQILDNGKLFLKDNTISGFRRLVKLKPVEEESGDMGFGFSPLYRTNRDQKGFTWKYQISRGLFPGKKRGRIEGE